MLMFVAIMVCIVGAGVVGLWMHIDDMRANVQYIRETVEVMSRRVNALDSDVAVLVDIARLRHTLNDH